MELKGYFRVIRKRWVLIASIVFVVVIAAGIKGFLLTTPVYYANSKLIVNQFNPKDQNAITMADLQPSLFLINSYKEIIKSEAIINKVVERYPDLGVSPAEISSKISVTNSNDSQVMNLSYQDVSYERAANIVNAVATVFKEEIPQIMNVDNITILTQANPQATAAPINISPITFILISLVVSLMVAVGIVFLLDYLDDSLKTEEDVANLISLPVLAVVGKITKDDLKASRKAAISQNAQVGEKQYATINQ